MPVQLQMRQPETTKAMLTLIMLLSDKVRGSAFRGSCLLMNNERLTIPEVIFNPSDIGIEQAGLAEVAVVVAPLDAAAGQAEHENAGL